MVAGSAPAGASLWNAGTSVADCGSPSEDRWLAPDIDCCGRSNKANANANKINRAEHFWIKGIKISPYTGTFRKASVWTMGALFTVRCKQQKFQCRVPTVPLRRYVQALIRDGLSPRRQVPPESQIFCRRWLPGLRRPPIDRAW